MRILLIRPPSVYGENLRGYQLDLPLGLLYIAGVLEKEGHDVKVIDGRIYFKDKGLVNTYAKRGELDKIYAAIKEEVKKLSPDAVGISNQFTAQVESAVRTAEAVKAADPRIITIAGGPHSVALPETFFNNTNTVDIVVLGEGERVAQNLARCLSQKGDLRTINGIAFKEKGAFTVNKREALIENLDELPYPAYHLIKMEDYFEAEKLGFAIRGVYKYTGSERAVSMITSRGCPYGCVFCSIHLHMGRGWRGHSSEYVLKHIQFLKDKYGVKHVHFEDDNINFEPKRLEAIISGLGGKNGITWDTPNGLRADRLNEELLERCKENGCAYLIIGVESGARRVLKDVVHKSLDLKDVVRAAKLCKKAGVDLRAFYVIGFPGETKSEIKRTMNFALMLYHKYNVTPHLHVAYPHIGTKLYDICKEKGFLTKDINYDSFHEIISGAKLIQTDTFSIQELNGLHDDFHRRFSRIIRLKLFTECWRRPLSFISYLKDMVKNPFERERMTMDFVSFKNCRKRKLGVNGKAA